VHSRLDKQQQTAMGRSVPHSFSAQTPPAVPVAGTGFSGSDHYEKGWTFAGTGPYNRNTLFDKSTSM
jgi:hypothetical protein